MQPQTNDSITSAQQYVAQLYKNSALNGLDARSFMAEVLREIISQLHRGREAYRAGMLDVMCDHHAKIFCILSLLIDAQERQENSHDEDARLAANFMSGLYQRLNTRLIHILRTPSAEDEFQRLIDMVLPVYRAWIPADQNAYDPRRTQSLIS